jgi:hypothetical protein
MEGEFEDVEHKIRGSPDARSLHLRSAHNPALRDPLNLPT